MHLKFSLQFYFKIIHIWNTSKWVMNYCEGGTGLLKYDTIEDCWWFLVLKYFTLFYLLSDTWDLGVGTRNSFSYQSLERAWHILNYAQSFSQEYICLTALWRQTCAIFHGTNLAGMVSKALHLHLVFLSIHWTNMGMVIILSLSSLLVNHEWHSYNVISGNH